MTITQMLKSFDWLKKQTRSGCTYELESNELGLAIYEDDGLTRRAVGYIRMSDGRVVLWYPSRKTSE